MTLPDDYKFTGTLNEKLAKNWFDGCTTTDEISCRQYIQQY